MSNHNSEVAEQAPSRREFIAYSSISLLILGACQSQEHAATGKSNKPSQPEKRFVSVDSVDPVTAVKVTAALFTIATGIKDLFFDKSSRDIKRRLNQLRAQNSEIIRLLGEVLSVLNGLGVVVQRAVREEFQSKTLRDLNTAFVGVIQNRLAETEDATYASEAEAEYRLLLWSIRSLSGDLARYQDFGFGLFDWVGHGMMLELWLYERLGTHFARVRQAANGFVEYFDAVLDPTLENSLGAQLAKARARRDRFDELLMEADALAAQLAGVIVKRRVQTGKKGRITYYADVQQTLTGSRAAGYSYRQEYVNPTSVEAPSPGGNVSSDRGGSQGGINKNKLVPDPVDNGDRTPAGRASYFNAVRAAYAGLMQEMPALENAARSAQLYLDAARERTQQP